jgi:hypothetical protein
MLKLLPAFIVCIAAFSTHYQAPGLAQPKKEPVLKLTTEILSQRYCKGDTELDGVWLELKLRHQNVGNQQRILYRASDSVYQVKVSRNLADAAAVKYEVNSRLSWYSNGVSRNFSESALNKAFVILPPSGVHETKTIAGVFVRREGVVKRIDGSVESGEHYIQVTLPTWYDTQGAADRLRKKWERRGSLWTEPVTSSPMRFVVDKQREVLECQ